MKKVEIIRKGQIDTAQKQHFRQYLTGHLQNPQPELKHIEGDIEVGISNYEQFTADTPHIHPNLSENVKFSDIFYIAESLMWFQKAIFDNKKGEFPLRFPLIWAIWAD